MAVRTVGIGHQNFGQLIQANCFYIDKTDFIRQWWENQDAVTLITRPRRFGKTLTMSMVEHFFSTEYAGRGDLFESLSIWREAPPGRGRVPWQGSRLQAATGNLPRHQPFFRQCEREGLSACP